MRYSHRAVTNEGALGGGARGPAQFQAKELP